MYRYVCHECGETFDRQISIADLNDQRVQCPHGHKKVQRVYSAPAIIFKGSGWYSKDNAKSAK
jgi:putative FmdB family regulatory protein